MPTHSSAVLNRARDQHAMREEEIHVRTDVSAVFEGAAAAGVISLEEPWMYMYSVGSAHYFKHVITSGYRMWDEDQEGSLS